MPGLVPHTGHLQLQCPLNIRYKNAEDIRLHEIINQSSLIIYMSKR